MATRVKPRREGKVPPKPSPAPQVQDDEIEEPDISHIETDNGEPVDNIFSEKQQRLLAESLNSSWQPQRDFAVFANVGLFYAIHLPAVVPDFMLSMEVRIPPNILEKKHSTYFVWQYGKPPELVLEIVSNKKGRELDDKKRIYAQTGVDYYVVFDPAKRIQPQALEIYENHAGEWIKRKKDFKLPRLGLSLTLWAGLYEGVEETWLRWCDDDGNLIPTGAESSAAAKALAERQRERADQEAQRADQESQRADQAAQRAEKERQRAQRLAEKLRALGLDEKDLEI